MIITSWHESEFPTYRALNIRKVSCSTFYVQYQPRLSVTLIPPIPATTTPQTNRKTPMPGTPSLQHAHPSTSPAQPKHNNTKSTARYILRYKNVYRQSPMTVMRELYTMKTDCASAELETRSGELKSSIGRSGFHRGQRPPNVNVVARKRPGMCRRGLIVASLW